MKGLDFGEALDFMAEKISEANRNENDYVGKDGFVYCGYCNMPKQSLVNWHDGGKKLVPIPCKCKKDKLTAKKEAETIAELKSKSNFEERFRNCTFEDLVVNDDNRKNVILCKRYVAKFDELFKENQGLLFYGNTGTGKSMMAHCVGNELIKKLYSSASLSLAKILKSGFKNAEEEAAIMSKVKNVKLLIVDDLGAERGTDYAQEFVYSVIDTRCNSLKPMIVTTNLTLEDMQRCQDLKYKRIYERILDCCYPVLFTGTSWRMRHAAQRYDKLSKMLEGDS